jgi:hypothetical protein
MHKVDIRFNTNFPSKSKYEWRVLIDGVETLVNNVIIDTLYYTTSTFIEGQGMKWHLSADSNNVDFKDLPNNKIATIK